jgi:chorismate mutase
MNERVAALRGAIDEVDNQLMDLVSRRMELVREMALVKAEHSLPVYDPQREAQITARAVRRPSGARVCEVMTYLLSVSRSEMVVQNLHPRRTEGREE